MSLRNILVLTLLLTLGSPALGQSFWAIKVKKGRIVQTNKKTIAQRTDVRYIKKHKGNRRHPPAYRVKTDIAYFLKRQKNKA